jgi:hypothetical protein
MAEEVAVPVDDEVILMSTNEPSMLSCQVQPTSIYFRSLLDFEISTAFCIRNKNVLTLNKETNTWTTLGACSSYHSRLVSIPSQNGCLVIGGSIDIEGTKPIDNVIAFTKD